MKFRLFLLCALCVPVLNALALDREAFTFTNYDLTVRIEPEQQRLGARGKITLRNDSSTPQKIAVLQISSSLGWRSIKAAGKQLQFVSQSFASDIDHTGSLSEAIVTLAEAIPPKASVDLEIAYEGVIVLDATRLTRIGAPEAEAKTSDWDQISTKFTAVRGAGNVAWYPIATEDASLSEGASLSEILGRWKAREAGSTMRLQMSVLSGEGDAPELLVNATACPTSQQGEHDFVADCSYRSLATIVPAFVIANYETVEHPSVSVHFLPGQCANRSPRKRGSNSSAWRSSRKHVRVQTRLSKGGGSSTCSMRVLRFTVRASQSIPHRGGEPFTIQPRSLVSRWQKR